MVGTYSKQFLHFLVTFNLTLDPRPGLQETQCTTSYTNPNQFSHSLLRQLIFLLYPHGRRCKSMSVGQKPSTQPNN